jgi:hypothetical protein
MIMEAGNSARILGAFVRFLNVQTGFDFSPLWFADSEAESNSHGPCSGQRRCNH